MEVKLSALRGKVVPGARSGVNNCTITIFGHAENVQLDERYRFPKHIIRLERKEYSGRGFGQRGSLFDP